MTFVFVSFVVVFLSIYCFVEGDVEKENPGDEFVFDIEDEGELDEELSREKRSPGRRGGRRPSPRRSPRPAPRPAPRPVARPAPRPAPKPAVRTVPKVKPAKKKTGVKTGVIITRRSSGNKILKAGAAGVVIGGATGLAANNLHNSNKRRGNGNGESNIRQNKLYLMLATVTSFIFVYHIQ